MTKITESAIEDLTFMAWKTVDGKLEASPLISQLETLITGMLNKATLLDLLP